MEQYSVLICDDNLAIHNSLTNYLDAEGIRVISAFDGETAINEFHRQGADVIVLDIMLPGIDGYEVCRTLRKHSDVHIIMLSSRSEEIDRVSGLEFGADDYLTKPFSPREIVVRIRNAIRRKYPQQEPKALTIAELSVYPESYEVYIKDEKIDMTSKEFEVLSFLVSNAGKVLTREHILNAAWGYAYYGDTRVVDALIKRIRQKLLVDGVHFAIRTIYGVGYKLEETP